MLPEISKMAHDASMYTVVLIEEHGPEGDMRREKADSAPEAFNFTTEWLKSTLFMPRRAEAYKDDVFLYSVSKDFDGDMIEVKGGMFIQF